MGGPPALERKLKIVNFLFFRCLDRESVVEWQTSVLCNAKGGAT